MKEASQAYRYCAKQSAARRQGFVGEEVEEKEEEEEEETKVAEEDALRSPKSYDEEILMGCEWEFRA